MFITYSLPFLDLRTFLKEDTYRLNEALWNYPEFEKTFIRSVGEMKERYKLNPAITYYDRQYAGAKNAVHINTNYRSEKFPYFIPYIQYRRLYYDNITGRLDIGIRSQRPNRLDPFKVRKRWQYSSMDIYSLIEWLFGMPASVKTKGDTYIPAILYNTGKPLAHLFAYATTKQPGKNYSESLGEKIAALNPQLILECKTDELTDQSTKSFDNNVRFIKVCSDMLQEWDVELYLAKIRQCPVWVIVKPANNLHYDDIKNLRIYITKLQQNRSALKCLFKQLKLHQNGFNVQNLKVEKIEQFMGESLKLIGRKKVSGYTVELITKLLNQIDSIINGDELEFLLTEYEDIKEIYHFKGRLEYMANNKMNHQYTINAEQVNIVNEPNAPSTFIGRQYNGITEEELSTIIQEILRYKHLAQPDVQAQIDEALSEAEETLITHSPDKSKAKKCIENIKYVAALINGAPKLLENLQKLMDFIYQSILK